MSYPRPAPSWVFDESLEDWVPPLPRPTEEGTWAWSEPHQRWELVTPKHAGVPDE